MNPVLAEILQTKSCPTPDGSGTIEIHSAISPEEGQMLSRLIARKKPSVSLEIGLAFGVSALFICEAMKNATATPKHIIIDPAQHAAEYWKGAGLANLNRAGYADMVEFIEKPSHLALPELLAAGRTIDFAFIDGEHLFDYAMVDFFFVDQLLSIGGTVVFDDAGWPAIRRLARFVASNRRYKVIDHVGSDIPGKTRHLAYATPESMEMDKRLGLQGDCIAMEKLAHDERPCTAYVEF